MNQIIRAFSEVTSSFQYLVRSWSTIIDLISVFKRLQAFESAFKGGLSIAIDDIHIPDSKDDIINKADANVVQINEKFKK